MSNVVQLAAIAVIEDAEIRDQAPAGILEEITA